MIIDSQQQLQEVLKLRQDFPAPKTILSRQRLVTVTYYSFDQKLHQGEIIVDQDLVSDIQQVFQLIKKIKFPIKSVIPYIDRHSLTEEQRLLTLNNSSGFKYRYIGGTTTLSNHAFGKAVDLNPRLNPLIKNGQVIPEDCVYDSTVPGTFTSSNPVVQCFKSLGWDWGGEWTDLKDYMHFEKISP